MFHPLEVVDWSIYLIIALFSLCPTQVTTYKSGAQNSNSLSQLGTVDSGALMRKGPVAWPYKHQAMIGKCTHIDLYFGFGISVAMKEITAKYPEHLQKIKFFLFKKTPKFSKYKKNQYQLIFSFFFLTKQHYENLNLK